MFKNEDTSLEILISLNENLEKEYITKKYSLDKVSRAVSHLKNAASIFSKAGLHKEASYLLRIANEIDL